MTKKEFARRILSGKKDSLQEFLDSLRRRGIRFCVIGGLAVNAYTEPVVSLDLQVVVAADQRPGLGELILRRLKSRLSLPLRVLFKAA